MSRKRQTPTSSPRPEEAIRIRGLAIGYSSGYVQEAHSHPWGQLIHAVKGVMTVSTDEGSWVVPPMHAVWVPAQIDHSIEMEGEVALRTIYVDPTLTEGLPQVCRVAAVSPFLRELILHVLERVPLYDGEKGHDSLIGVVVDQVSELEEVPLELPMPRDRRAVSVARQLRENPSDSRSLDELVKGSGAAKRTVERLFQAETGMAFGRWRTRLRLLHALRLLSTGMSILNVSMEVGYESPSAFTSMFRRVLGTTPSRYDPGVAPEED